MKDMQKRT